MPNQPVKIGQRLVERRSARASQRFVRWAGVPLLLMLAGVGLHSRVKQLLNQPLPAGLPRPTMTADQPYFAYGSNMSTRYLTHARGVLPARSETATADGHELAFLAPGLPMVEPAFAFIVPRLQAQAHGVVHWVSTADLQRIQASEGSRYAWRTISVRLASGGVVSAHTLLPTATGSPGLPSRRYLKLLIEGGKEHGLPTAYINRLSATPSAYLPLVSELAGDLITASVMHRSGRCTWLVNC